MFEIEVDRVSKQNDIDDVKNALLLQITVLLDDEEGIQGFDPKEILVEPIVASNSYDIYTITNINLI